MINVIKKVVLILFVMAFVPIYANADVGAKISIGKESNYDKKTGIVEFYVDAENSLFCNLETDENCSSDPALGTIEYDEDVLEFIETDEKVSNKADGKLEFSIDYTLGTANENTVQGNGTFKFKVKDQSKEYTTIILKDFRVDEDSCFYSGCLEGNGEYTVKLEPQKTIVIPEEEKSTELTTEEKNNNSLKQYLMYGSFGLNGLLLILLLISLAKNKKNN